MYWQQTPKVEGPKNGVELSRDLSWQTEVIAAGPSFYAGVLSPELKKSKHLVTSLSGTNEVFIKMTVPQQLALFTELLQQEESGKVSSLSCEEETYSTKAKVYCAVYQQSTQILISRFRKAINFLRFPLSWRDNEGTGHPVL